MARAAGVDGLAVSFGAHARDALIASEPVACLDCDRDLWSWLQAHA